MRFYKILLAAVVLLGAAMPATAQFRYAGIVGGLITNLHFKQDLAPVSKVGGFQAGVLGELMFPGIGFGIDLGAIYNMGGANVDLGDKLIWSSEGYGKTRVMLHQLQIPFHLRFKWTRMGGFEDTLAPFVYGGPEFNILLGHNRCKAIDYSGGDLSLAVGGGVEILRRWQLSASYTWGMTYALKTKLLTDYSARTRQVTVRLAYYF
ncbi:MAG: PorT family protein [Bacteroidales bacterium]|nr:PorT family protein [Bacteroidales bacterium]